MKFAHATIDAVPLTIGGVAVPRLIVDIDPSAPARFVAFFESRVQDRVTRKLYAQAIAEFCAWIDRRLHDIFEMQPITVSLYLVGLRRRVDVGTAREHWMALRVLFDWLLSRGLVESNPVAAVPSPELGLSLSDLRDDAKPYRDCIDVTVLPAANV